MSSRPSSMEELYSVAVSLPADQRHDYVVANCSDTSARRQLLQMLEDESSGAGSVYDGNRRPVLTAGMRFAHYRIESSLGAGGMGQVYEAVDESLGRHVAIKVLPAGRYDDASRERFRREAEAASALNHPNIVTVYEVGRWGEVDFIAMERIAGQTLDRVAGGRPMPLRSAVEIAIQIADALSAAHEAGIVHRDLKPLNIMVTDRDVVKVLDFGVAKQVTGSGIGRRELSSVGEIIGTADYMSPEQAEGKPVDARSDIFAFGTLLYQMLTGRLPFHGQTVHATLAAISAAEAAPLRTLRTDAPRLLESLVSRCIRKQPYQRWQSLCDVKLLLQEVLTEIGAVSSADIAPQRRTPRRLLYAAGAAVAGAALTLAILRPWRDQPAPPSSVLRLVTAEKGLSTAPVLSRDGVLLAFASDRAGQGNLDIWIQQVGGTEPMRLTSDAADESDPTFSPDGVKVAYRSEKDGGGIYLIPSLGGDPVLVAASGRNPRFSPDGKSIAYWIGREGSQVAGASKPFVVDLAGGAPRQLDTQLLWAQYPVWSPDGRSLLVYGIASGSTAVDWWLVPAAGGNARPVGIGNAIRPLVVRYFPVVALDWYVDDSGPCVLFARDGGDYSNLWRIGLSSDGKLGGTVARVTDGPGRHLRATLSRSKDGVQRLAFSDETVNYDVWRLPVQAATGLASGDLQPVTDRLTPDMNPSISGDGKHAYFITARMGGWSLVRKDLDANRERVLHNSPRLLYNARVAPFGSRVFFSTSSADLAAIPTDGGVVETLCAKCGSVTGVSDSGDRVAFQPRVDEHLMVFDVASRSQVKLADRGDPHVMLDGRISPDGRWAAFHATNDQTRATTIYVAPVYGELPVPRTRWIPISGETELARDALFAPSGRFLYYTSEKDGFRCLWARRLHPETRMPEGEPFAVRHFHTTRLGLRNRAGSGNLIGLSAGGNSLVFALAEVTGNLWLEETKLGE